MARARKSSDFEQVLGHTFRDRALFDRALTHASMRGGKTKKDDNERLEFIGDRVLGLAIAEILIEALPDATEGELARSYNRLVCGDACARVARNLGLGPHLIVSESEAGSGGRDKETILADAMEAVLGAVFLEAGYETARSVVRGAWRIEQNAVSAALVDPKSALQEWAQGQGLALPHYVEVSRSGPDHAPVFVSEVRIVGKNAAQGTGSSKRAAEQAAATELLVREGVRAAVPDE